MENADSPKIEIEPRGKVLIVNLNVDKKPYLSIASHLFDQPKKSPDLLENAVVSELVKHPDDANEKLSSARMLLPFERLGEYKAIILTGSQMTPIPKSMESGKLLLKEWKNDLYKMIRAAGDQNIPMLGICFGEQVIAEALGGKVELSVNKNGKKFWEIGWSWVHRVSGSGNDKLLEGLPTQFLVPQNHDYMVTKLPEGAVPLLINNNGIQAFRIGNTWAVQFHPEKSFNDVVKLMGTDDNKKKLEARKKNIDAILDLGRKYDGQAARIIQNFMKISWNKAQ